MSAPSPFQVDSKIQALLSALDDQSWIDLKFNGIKLFLPAGTVITMAHCLAVDVSGGIVLNVETSHLDWMRSRLGDGATFLDVGASTGAMTLPIASAFPHVRIIAFEPARRARRLLKASLVKNDMFGVTVSGSAVSERSGSLFFAEHGLSADGSVPFLPETSTIVLSVASGHANEVLEVPTTTFDEIATTYGLDGARVVVKLDIEGFEGQALSAAGRFFASNNVSIAIDIHSSPTDPTVMTEAECRSLLSGFGYQKQEMLGHVLLCERV